MKNSGLQIRWCPSELMLADALTKDQYEPSELLRTALEIGEYQLNAEAFILAIKSVKELPEKIARKAAKNRDPAPHRATKAVAGNQFAVAQKHIKIQHN